MDGTCPNCGSDDLDEVIYGYPTQSTKSGTSLGGCMIGPDGPDWICNACQHQWQTPDSPRALLWAEYTAQHQPPR